MAPSPSGFTSTTETATAVTTGWTTWNSKREVNISLTTSVAIGGHLLDRHWTRPVRGINPTLAAPGIVSTTGRIGSRVAWTVWNVAAWCAATLSWRIATRRNAPARLAARLRCLTVEPAGTADVYCLTVPGPSSFCLANGAVVHNTRYMARSGIARMKRKPAKPEGEGKILPFDRDHAQLGWMGG